VYNLVAAEGKQQQAILDQLGARLQDTESLNHVHLAGSDYNVSFLMHVRVTATAVILRRPTCARKQFIFDPQRSVAWWTGHIKGGMYTRRSQQFAQAARLDEILVYAGNSQLPQDMEEGSAQSFEFYIHTAHHGDSRLDHGTLIADLPVTLFL